MTFSHAQCKTPLVWELLICDIGELCLELYINDEHFPQGSEPKGQGSHWCIEHQVPEMVKAYLITR